MKLDVVGGAVAFEPSGVAVLADGTVAISAPGPAVALYEPVDTVSRASFAPEGFRLPLRDPRLDCVRCTSGAFRASSQLAPHPIRWQPWAGQEVEPLDVEDLAAFGGAQVLGITGYSTVGRRTGYRKDNTARPRAQTERVFVLERMADPAGGPGVWEERRLPEIDRFRDALSDWGRSRCDGDMRVQGLAWDALDGVAYVGLRRCGGPVVRVLSYALRASAGGQAVDIVEAADGVVGGAGPEEGITGLHWNGGLWATTAWDSYGHATEPAWGGRLHRVTLPAGQVGTLEPSGEGFLDRPAALWLPTGAPGAAPPADAVVLFDDETPRASAPTMTFVRAPVARPADGAWAGLTELRDLGEGLPLGLNGFDLRWYARDHRLAQLDIALDRRADGAPGGWTRAVGGLWQMRVGGSLGLLASATGLSRHVGHNRQAVAGTDWADAPGLRFHAFRAALTVVPRDRERQNPSVAQLAASLGPDYTVTATLPVAASPGAGLVLQGLEIDTSARADRGICLAAMDMGVSWHSDAHDAVDVRAMLVGGLCNDFDTRGSGLRHGRTTDVAGGVSVGVRFAVVEGGAARTWSASVADLRLPDAPPAAPSMSDDRVARAHVHCVALPDGRDLAPGDAAGRHLDVAVTGEPVSGALSGFALALDPVGFDPAAADRPLTEAQALNRNAYIHRYLVRAFGGAGAVLEGGITHGIHRTGFMRDNQTPSALLLRADLTGFAQPGRAWDMVPDSADDPNLLPEDGFVRWATALPRAGEAACSREE